MTKRSNKNTNDVTKIEIIQLSFVKRLSLLRVGWACGYGGGGGAVMVWLSVKSNSLACGELV